MKDLLQTWRVTEEWGGVGGRGMSPYLRSRSEAAA